MKVYLDNQASTPVDPRVVQLVSRTLAEEFGNSASTLHAWGWRAEEITTIAREQCAAIIGASAKDIIFTSGATESINMTILGLREMEPKRVAHTTIEHKAVTYSCHELERCGFERAEVPVDSSGRIRMEELERILKTPTLILSVIAANNEIGTIQDIKAISQLCRNHETLLHLDITQLIGKVEVNIKEMGADFASFSSHKIYGPKGVGALYATSEALLKLRPIMFGGGQERGIRSGTVNVPGIAGFGFACKILKDEALQVKEHITKLTAILKEALESNLKELKINGHLEHRIPGNLNIRINGVDSNRLIGNLAMDVGLTAASACLSQSLANSSVLAAIGLSPKEQKESFRIGVGRFNTEEEILWAANKLVETARSLGAK